MVTMVNMVTLDIMVIMVTIVTMVTMVTMVNMVTVVTCHGPSETRVSPVVPPTHVVIVPRVRLRIPLFPDFVACVTPWCASRIPFEVLWPAWQSCCDIEMV